MTAPKTPRRAAVEPGPPVPAREPDLSAVPVADRSGTPSSPSLPSVAEAETRTPDPATGAGATSRAPAPVRGRAPQAPAGEGRTGSATPAGTTPLSGEEWRKAAKAELSSQGRERRRRSHRYVPVAKRTAYRPGMGVRKPPEPPREAS